MRFALTEDQVDFRDAVRALLAERCTPDAVRSAWGGTVGRHVAGATAGTGVGDGDGRVPAAWSALAEMGVLGLLVPEDHDGLGLTDEDLVPLLIECGRVGVCRIRSPPRPEWRPRSSGTPPRRSSRRRGSHGSHRAT